MRNTEPQVGEETRPIYIDERIVCGCDQQNQIRQTPPCMPRFPIQGKSLPIHVSVIVGVMPGTHINDINSVLCVV